MSDIVDWTRITLLTARARDAEALARHRGRIIIDQAKRIERLEAILRGRGRMTLTREKESRDG